MYTNQFHGMTCWNIFLNKSIIFIHTPRPRQGQNFMDLSKKFCIRSSATKGLYLSPQFFCFFFFFFVFRQNFHGRCSQTTTPSIFITSDILEFLGYDVIPRTQQQNFANFVSGNQIQKSLCLCPQFFCLFFSSSGTHFLSLSFFNYFKTMHPKTGRNKFQ